MQQQEQDPTNLYISNLPVSMDEQELESMLKPFGQVISTRILRDANGTSRGVGFARWGPWPVDTAWSMPLLGHTADLKVKWVISGEFWKCPENSNIKWVPLDWSRLFPLCQLSRACQWTTAAAHKPGYLGYILFLKYEIWNAQSGDLGCPHRASLEIIAIKYGSLLEAGFLFYDLQIYEPLHV